MIIVYFLPVLTFRVSCLLAIVLVPLYNFDYFIFVHVFMFTVCLKVVLQAWTNSLCIPFSMCIRYSQSRKLKWSITVYMQISCRLMNVNYTNISFSLLFRKPSPTVVLSEAVVWKFKYFLLYFFAIYSVYFILRLFGCELHFIMLNWLVNKTIWSCADLS